jgi:hypothetical protein
MSVCDIHKESTEFLEIRDLFEELVKGTRPDRQDLVRRYLYASGFSLISALSQILPTEKSKNLEEVFHICSLDAVGFAKLLTHRSCSNSGEVSSFFRGLLNAMKQVQDNIAMEVVTLFGVFAKYGVPGSIEALRKCLHHSNKSVRESAKRQLNMWESLNRESVATYPDPPGFRNQRAHS